MGRNMFKHEQEAKKKKTKLGVNQRMSVARKTIAHGPNRKEREKEKGVRSHAKQELCSLCVEYNYKKKAQGDFRLAAPYV